MNIKKMIAAALAFAAALCLFAGCSSGSATAVKDEGQITIFVDKAVGEAVQKLATAYTKPVRELPEREKAIILIVPATAEDIIANVNADEYADAVFVSDAAALDALDAAAGGEDHVVHSSRVQLSDAQGQTYGIAILNGSDRQSVAQGFIDYIMSDEADAVLNEYGLNN